MALTRTEWEAECDLEYERQQDLIETAKMAELDPGDGETCPCPTCTACTDYCHGCTERKTCDCWDTEDDNPVFCWNLLTECCGPNV